MTLSTPTPDPPVPRPLEYLDVRSVDAQTLASFKTFDWMIAYVGEFALNLRIAHNHRHPSMNLIKSNNRKNGSPFYLFSPSLRSSVIGGYGPPSIQSRERRTRLSCSLSNFAQSFVNSATAISTRSALRGESPLSGRESLARG